MKRAWIGPMVGLVCLGCSEAAPPPEVAPGCNPIGDDCFTPFPSRFHETADSSTATGVRVTLDAATLPSSAGGVALRPDRFNQKDGFSPSSPFLAYFKGGVDATQLPTLDTLAASATAASAVQVLEYATGARVPVFAELDANAGDGDRQALIIRPMVRLKAQTRYVVALVQLRDPKGNRLAPANFRALRDGTPLSHSLAPHQARYQEIFAALEHAGVHRGDLSLAWDVITASDATATGHLVAMRDTALAMADTLGYTITKTTETPSDAHRLREVLATVQVPSFLASDAPDAMMNFGADGQPAVRALVDVPIVVEIPQCARTATHPLPILVFGHGLFGTAFDTLQSSTLQQAADEDCMILAATDWIGLAYDDLATISNQVLTDLNNIYIVTDRLQQAHVNAQMMARQLRYLIKADPAMALNGTAITDGTEAYYFGVSDGGIQGGTFMALSPDIERGVLNVPGCEWSLMMYRSTDFNAMIPVLDSIYPDLLDQQILVALSQSEWDHTDPAAFAPHLIADPLPGSIAKRVLLQESIGDAQVPNMATRVLARTIGVPGLDLEQPVYGVDAQPAPLASAYTQWDTHLMPLPPTGNMPLGADNHAHESIQNIPQLKAQVRAFLSPDGQVTSTCHGPCSYPQ